MSNINYCMIEYKIRMFISKQNKFWHAVIKTAICNYGISLHSTNVAHIYMIIIYEMFTTSLVAAVHKVKGHYKRK